MSKFLQGIEELVRLHDRLARERLVEDDRLARDRLEAADRQVRKRLEDGITGASLVPPPAPVEDPPSAFVAKLRELGFTLAEDCVGDDPDRLGEIHLHPMAEDPGKPTRDERCQRCEAPLCICYEVVATAKWVDKERPTLSNELGYVCPACGLVEAESPERSHEGVLGLLFVEGCDLLATLSIFEGGGEETRLTKATRHALTKEEAALTRRITEVRTLLSRLPGSAEKGGTLISIGPRVDASPAPPDPPPDDGPAAA